MTTLTNPRINPQFNFELEINGFYKTARSESVGKSCFKRDCCKRLVYERDVLLNNGLSFLP